MPGRNFVNFIDAYVNYADNNFSPRLFHTWSAISIVAAALERKVSLPWGKAKPFFPNMFILLVAHPGAGKSSASDRAVAILREASSRSDAGITFIPQQLSQAMFVKIMKEAVKALPGPIDPKRIVTHCSGYYYASEASNGLYNLFGDFIANITEFYDCPEHFKRMTMGAGDFSLNKVCFNLLAASTHDYLSKLITDQSIRGGFASRLIYAVSNEKKIRNVKFQDGGPSETPSDLAMKNRLIDDLSDICRLQGEFTASADFARLYEKWYPTSEAMRFAHKSESMQSLLVRRPTIIIKLAMIFAAAESGELFLRKEHWERAEAEMVEVERGLPEMLREAKAGDIETQAGMHSAIFRFFEVYPEAEHTLLALRQYLTGKHLSPQKAELSIAGFEKSRFIKVQGERLILLVKPNDFL